MTNTSKETYTEEEQPVETYVYSDEEQKENSLVEENNIKKFMFAAVILPLMIVCVISFRHNGGITRRISRRTCSNSRGNGKYEYIF